MLPSNSVVRKYFAKLGLPSEIADLYLALHTHGPQSISELSRNANVERTHIYRLSSQLLDSKLVEIEGGSSKGILKAAPIANLSILISKKELDLTSLRDDLELIEQALARNSLSSPSTKVHFYKGPEAIRQIFSYQTRSSTELLFLLNSPITAKTDLKFINSWSELINQSNLNVRILHDQKFEQLNKKQLFPKTLKNSKVKKIINLDYKITQNTSIWDDNIAFFNWIDGEIYASVITNSEFAKTQIQFFNLLWSKID